MLIDRYVAIETWKRLSIALAVVLVALIIERLLRLFDVVSMHGGPMDMVWQMAMFLIPHYAGLALPAGFFLSIFLVVARLGDDNEFDAILNCGLSPLRFAAPFLVSATVLVALSTALYGYVQPYSRYAYRAAYYLAVNIPWQAKVPEQAFTSFGKNTVVTAERVTGMGSTLEGVFVHQTLSRREVITTATWAELDFDVSRTRFGLRLHDGTQAIVAPDGKVSFSNFDILELDRSFASALPLFRSRGNDVRELSLGELLEMARDPAPALPLSEVQAELHARLVRAASLLVLPFLAVPMALAAKRRRRGMGIVFGFTVLFAFHYVLQTLEGLADKGKVPAAALWIAAALFAAGGVGLFWRAQRRPGENIVERLFALFADTGHAGKALLRRVVARRA